VGGSVCEADGVQHILKIFEHVVDPESDGTIAVARKLGGTTVVGLGSLGMLTAVELNHQFAGGTGEIGDASSEGCRAELQLNGSTASPRR
jgi:hypothetical protein